MGSSNGLGFRDPSLDGACGTLADDLYKCVLDAIFSGVNYK